MAGKVQSRGGGGNCSLKRKENGGGGFNKKKKHSGPHKGSGNKKKGAKSAHRGPRLPNALRKVVDVKKTNYDDDDYSDDVYENPAFAKDDLYEYEEAFAEEESRKNKRFDTVENFQYELPEDFKDENIASDDENIASDDFDDDEDHKGDSDDDGERHGRLLQEITGLPSEAFEGKKNKGFVASEAPIESENNQTSDFLGDDGPISIHDLLDPLQGKRGYSKLRKITRRMDNKADPILAPLPKTEGERLERKVAYEHSKKDITKWEHKVKINREASTLYFDEDKDVGFSTIGAIASEFEPRTEFEKNIAALVNNNEVVEAHKKDGARLLELNKISVEEMKNHKDRIAKMRSVLFRHELKAKRIKKIKSKTYHRLLKKDKRKAAEAAYEFDPEAAKELARKQEFKRAEERMRLKHKNSSRWAKRILERGLSVQDEATREAFGEQLNKHAALTRKMNSVNDSSSDESSDEDSDDDMSADSDRDVKSELLMKAKEKTLNILEADEELPNSGVLSLPFMVRGLNKRKEVAEEEANAALKEYEDLLVDDNVKRNHGASSGRMVFGAPKRTVKEPSNKNIVKSDNYFGNSDSDSDVEPEEEIVDLNGNKADIDPISLREALGINHDSIFKSSEDITNPEPNTSYEVAYLASDSWKKIKKTSDGVEQNGEDNVRKSEVRAGPQLDSQDSEEDDDTDSEVEMVDGILTSGTKSTYKLPSQEELIQLAFAGDDVEEAFDKDKMSALDEENPEPEEPKVIPGWGQWTDVQQRRGIPKAMQLEHEVAKRKRNEALQKRGDAHLAHVIISEKPDKKTDKLHIKSVPFPYTSKEVYEQSNRMPIAPESNPSSVHGALIRPEVVKTPGVIIKPIQYEDMNVREKAEFNRRSGQKRKNGKGKNGSTKKSKA